MQVQRKMDLQLLALLLNICDLYLVVAFIIKFSRFRSPSCSFVVLRSWVTLGLCSKGVNMIEMMPYG